MADSHLVLVVDDDSNNLELLMRMVKLAGHEVVSADCGSAAITAVASTQPDLVLLDWMMPDLSGIDVLRSIRQDYDENTLPVIMCTALTESEYVSAALKEGANDFLTKPVNPDVLAARITSQLSRKTAMQTMDSFNRELEETVADRTRKLLEMSSVPLDAAVTAQNEMEGLRQILQAVAEGDVRSVCTYQTMARSLLNSIFSTPNDGEDIDRAS